MAHQKPPLQAESTTSAMRKQTSRASVRNNIALNELIHGLTLHELATPRVDPKVIAELTALRERLIEALPKHLRAKFDEAVSSEWYDRYASGKNSEHYATYGP